LREGDELILLSQTLPDLSRLNPPGAAASAPSPFPTPHTINPDFGQVEVDPAVVNLTAPSRWDLIRDKHPRDIFHSIPNSQLAILPNVTHMVPFDVAASFNAVLERFFRTPLVKKDRIGDTMKTLAKLRSR